METLNIKKADALKAHKRADEKGKQLLADLLGNQVNFSEKITDRIKTFEDACEEIGITASDALSGSDSKDEVAYKKLKVIARALNEGWEPDYSNSSQYKYYPWFKFFAGSGFRFGGYGCDGSLSCLGARLCFKTSELAEYAAKQFEAIYNDFLTL